MEGALVPPVRVGAISIVSKTKESVVRTGAAVAHGENVRAIVFRQVNAIARFNRAYLFGGCDRPKLIPMRCSVERARLRVETRCCLSRYSVAVDSRFFVTTAGSNLTLQGTVNGNSTLG